MNWELLLKYTNNETNFDETNEVDTWLDEQAENKLVLDYLQKRKEQLQQPIKQDDIHQQWVFLLDRIFEQPKTLDKPHSNTGYWLMGIAASLLMVSLLGWFYKSSNNNEAALKPIVLQTPADKRAQVTLPDGSLVYMAPNSKLTYNSTFGQKNRELHLNGEAFFNVKHNAAKAFIIRTANNLSVTVLGTSFNVYSRSNHNTEVKVATGKVGVTIGSRTNFLLAGQQLNYELTNKRISLNPVEHNDAASLQNQTIFFKNNNADEIAEKLHRWYNINFEVLPTARKHPRFSGEMKDTGIDNLLKGLSYATGLKYSYKNQHIIILS